MKIGIYGRVLKEEHLAFVCQFLQTLVERGIQIYIYNGYWEQMSNQEQKKLAITETFTRETDLRNQIDCMISIGGDGTLLDTPFFIGDSGIPIMGVNVGRLGFLTSVGRDKALEAIDALQQKTYSLESRTLIRLESDVVDFGKPSYALNEVGILKSETFTMITVHVYINDEFLNSYWADGLIIATPTGSTGYSLSCGGPIIAPNSQNFVLTPVAPHNLTVRPLVIPDSSELSFEVEERAQKFLCTLDSRFHVLECGVRLKVRKEDFALNLVRLPESNFYKTIRTKLNWGLDVRN